LSRPEADIHFELYRHLQNSIEEKSTYYGIRFKETKAEVNVDSGFADIVVFGEGKKPFLVIEAKRKTKGGYDRNIDPYSPEVIDQSFHYAGKLGAEYFATYNGDRLVLFRTFEGGTHLLDRKTNAYDVQNIQEFAPSLLQEVAGLETGKLKWEPRHRAFVKRLEEFHGRLMMQMEKAVGEKLASDEEFKERYEEWIEAQGWNTENWDKVLQRFTAQAAYLLMNKLVFYKILEDEPAYREVPKLEFTSTENLTADLQYLFSRLVEEVDFEAIYEQDPIYDEVPLTPRAAAEIQEFLEELEEYDLTQFDHDVIGTIYEKIIPPKERHDLGQYYTPPEIVELITRMTVQEPDDKILDPGCGSGSFLVAAYNRLKKLKEEAGGSPSHSELLDQIYGIDINRFPAHLSAINLALRDLNAETKEVNIEVQNFFHVYPKQDRLAVEKMGVSGTRKITDPREINLPKEGDVVLANPPYIDWRRIQNKELCRRHLKRIGYEDLSRHSDIYVYFFTHATEFLEENGKIGFITSDKWLTVGYGKDLQKFFLENYKIEAIISFSLRVFEASLVPTCVTILEKTNKKEERDSNIIKFLRIKRSMKLSEIIEVVQSDYEPNLLQERGKYRLITKKQSKLKKAKKWDRYLYAPPIYWHLLDSEKVCKLGEVAEIHLGIQTGANSFFYLKEDEAESWGINERFLRPLAKSIRQVDSYKFTKEDTDYLVLDIHDYVEEKLQDVSEEMIRGTDLDEKTLPKNARLRDISPEEKYVLHCLYEEGYRNLYQYILHAMWEKKWKRYGPPQKRPNCLQKRQKNRCWFSLGVLMVPSLFLSKEYWGYGRPLALLNSGIVPDQQLYYIEPKENLDPVVLLGLLNSSLAALFREMHGRTTGGGMNRVTVKEARAMPIVNPYKLSKREKEKVKENMKSILDKGKNITQELEQAVLSPLGLEEKSKKLKSMLKPFQKLDGKIKKSEN